MTNCNDCWCEHYDKNMGNCDHCIKNESEREKPELNVILKRRAIEQMKLSETKNEKDKSRQNSR